VTQNLQSKTVHICFFFVWCRNYSNIFKYLATPIQPVPELPPHRKQASAGSTRDSKIAKINISAAHIKFSISPIPEVRPQVLQVAKTQK
jgi:hypothetical protein